MLKNLWIQAKTTELHRVNYTDVRVSPDFSTDVENLKYQGVCNYKKSGATHQQKSARKDQPSGHFHVSSPLRGKEAAGANLVRLSLRLLNLLGGELHTGVQAELLSGLQSNHLTRRE